MTDNRKAAMGFLKSLVLLVAALALFYVVVIAPSDEPPVEPVNENLLAALKREKRVTLRRAAGADDVASPKPQVEAVAPEAAKPASKSAALPALAGDHPDAGKFDEVPPLEAVDPDVQAAIELIDNGQVQEAVAKLEEVLKRDPKNEQALVELAMIHLLDLKQTDRAIEYLERVVAVNPQNRIVMSELVSLYEEEGRTDEGLAYMMQMHDQNPESSALSYGIGQMLANMGRDSEAIPYLEKAVQSSDNPVRAYRDLAEAYSRSGELDKAIDSYRKAIARQEQELQEKVERGMPSTFSEERLNYMKMDLARELIRAGDRAGAEQVIEQIEQAMPGDESVHALRQQLDRLRAG